MNSTFEYIALVQREREADIRNHHLVRLVDCFCPRCNPSLFDGLARALRRQPIPC